MIPKVDCVVFVAIAVAVLVFVWARAERLASRCPEWAPPTETDPTAEMAAFLKEE